MPHARNPDPVSPRPPATPLCAACGKQMHLIAVRRSVRYVNLDDCTYQCECGERGDYVIARKEEAD